MLSFIYFYLFIYDKFCTLKHADAQPTSGAGSGHAHHQFPNNDDNDKHNDWLLLWLDYSLYCCLFAFGTVDCVSAIHTAITWSWTSFMKVIFRCVSCMWCIKIVVIWRAAQQLYVCISILIPGLVKPEADRGQICAGFQMFIVGESIRNIHWE